MGVAPEQTIPYRYPGTKFFEPHQRAIFFGREQETHELTYAIKAYDVFVIFADSGIGKTSLLNAGLIPELEKENMVPVKFRFQDTSKPPLDTIYDTLDDFKTPGQQPVQTNACTLWRLFKCCQFHNKQPLFVFDQFEEFFNHHKQNRDDCIRELANLINEYLPDVIREEMREKFRENDPTPEELKYYTPARVKLLFLIRADKLKLLDDLSKKIPLILRNRFQLRPLSVKQAEQAILLPALLPKNGFASPSFNFQEEAVDEICHYLKNEEGEVESFQLQILCQELEKRILDRYQKEERSLWVSREELGGEAGMDSITKNYYNNQLLAIPDAGMRKKAFEVIEDKLMVEGRRISLPEILLVREGYSRELLEYLLNTTRIIRVYKDRNDQYYEISHDRLVPSIVQSREKRAVAENKLKEQRLKEEEEEKYRQGQERVSKKRYQRFSIILAILLVGLLMAIGSSIRYNLKAKVLTVNLLLEKQDYDRADSVLEVHEFSFLNFPFRDTLEKLDAISHLENSKKMEYESIIKRGDRLSASADTLLLITDILLDKADSLAAINAWPEIAKISYKGSNLLESLDIPELQYARKAYRKAQSTGFIPISPYENIGIRLSDLDLRESKAFGQCVNATLVFLHAGMQTNARMAYARVAYENAIKYKMSASENDIDLNPIALNVLDSLKTVLKQ